MRTQSTLAIVAALLLVGCGGTSTTPTGAPTTIESPPRDEATTTSTPSTTTTSTSTTSTSTTSTTAAPAEPSAAELCDGAITEAGLLIESLLDEIDEAVAEGESLDPESLEQMRTGSELIVEGCPGQLLPVGLSDIIVTLAVGAQDDDRSALAQQTSQTFLDGLCEIDATILDEPANDACRAEPLVVDATPERYREAFLVIWDNTLRAELVDVLGLSNDVDSVDLVDFDAETDTLIIDITSRWSSAGVQADGAWSIIRVLAAFWGQDSVFAYPDWPVALRFVNSGTVYECSDDFMQRLADTRASRSDWEQECSR